MQNQRRQYAEPTSAGVDLRRPGDLGGLAVPYGVSPEELRRAVDAAGGDPRHVVSLLTQAGLI